MHNLLNCETVRGEMSSASQCCTHPKPVRSTQVAKRMKEAEAPTRATNKGERLSTPFVPCRGGQHLRGHWCLRKTKFGVKPVVTLQHCPGDNRMHNANTEYALLIGGRNRGYWHGSKPNANWLRFTDRRMRLNACGWKGRGQDC